MKLKLYTLLFILAPVFFTACKSGKKSLKHGYYDAAVMESVNRLRSKPSHKKASMVLREAYPQALKYHMARINNFNISTDNSRYENIITEYETLNRLYDQIQLSPAAQLIVSPQRYTIEVNLNKEKAAILHYSIGQKYLDKKTKNDAKVAFNEFERASQLMQGNFKDCDAKMKEAMDWAITKVIVLPVEVHSTSLKMSNDYFQNKILQYLYEHRMSKFVEFYSEAEAKKTNIRMDEILDLNFDDFVVGQLTVEKLQREVTNDSVIIGETKILIPGTKKDTVISVYGKAKATLFVTRRTVQSNGVLDMKIVDKNTNAILQNEKMPGSFTWINQYGYYQGDVKALKAEDLELIKGQELPPPMPQDLFVAFTQPIFTQLMGRITQRYSQY
jgi:hypothetical protein